MTDKPFGPACAGVPKDGAGSFDGMAKDPVATAASNNPALSTLVAAVQKAGLVDTLNNAENITVFAPTNDAFAKIPKADLDAVLNDKAKLTEILTYHVVGQKLTPQQLESGTFDTLQKSTLTTAGSGESYKVNDSAGVVCGNVPTANATVYIIDTRADAEVAEDSSAAGGRPPLPQRDSCLHQAKTLPSAAFSCPTVGGRRQAPR